ncbi:hypothetical protein ACLOJK_022453 [Asimina triloba]
MAPLRPLSSRLLVSATNGGADGCDWLSRLLSSGRRSEGRMAGWGRETNACSPRIRARDLLPNPLLITTRDNLPSSSTVVVRLCSRCLLHFWSAVTVSHILSSPLDRCLSRSPHRLYQSSFAFEPSHFQACSAFVRISHRLLCSSSASGLAPFPASSPFLIGSPHHPRQSSPASVPALSLSSSPFPTTVLDSDAIFSIPDRVSSIPDRHHHFPHCTLPSSVSVLALSRLSSPTPTKAILAVVMHVLLP